MCSMFSTISGETANARGASNASISLGRFALFLALALASLFPTVILGWDTFFYRDYGVIAYPTVYHYHASFWRGELPLWNPYSNCGVPFLAQWGTMVLYPFSISFLVLPLPWSLNLFCLAHLFLGGLGMYALARRWVGDGFAASLAGTAFVFSGVTLSSLMWPNYTVALGWMPWVVGCVERAWLGADRRRLVLAALVGTLQLLSGVPEIVLLTWLLLLGLWTGRFVTGSLPKRALIQRASLVVLLVTGLAAIQLLPFFDLLAHSQKDATSATLKWAMPPWGWGNFLVPMFRCARTSQGMFFQIGEDFFASTYLGVIPLALAIMAICCVREYRVRLLAVLSVLCLLLALGESGWIYRAIRHVFPGLGFVRYPIKFVVLPAFALPLLAAYGSQAVTRAGLSLRSARWWGFLGVTVVLLAGIGEFLWITHRYPSPVDQWPVVWHSGAWRVVFLVAALCLLGGFQVWTTPPRQVGLALAFLAVLAGDALVAVPDKNPALSSSVMAPGLWKLQNKVAPPRFGEGRVMISPGAEQHLLISQVKDLENDFMGKRLALWSHLNLLEQIPKVNGSSTLQIREQKQIESLLYSHPDLSSNGLIRFLNVSYATAPGQVVDWAARQDFLPLVTAGQRPCFAGLQKTLCSITNSGFEPARTVFLPPEAARFIRASNGTSAKVLSTSFGTHQIDCTVDAPESSLVVIAQSFYHPWHAYVDDAPTRLWRANYAFQALEVPPGKHRVRIVYEDANFLIGAAISAVALLGCAGLWFWRRERPVEDRTS